MACRRQSRWSEPIGRILYLVGGRTDSLSYSASLGRSLARVLRLGAASVSNPLRMATSRPHPLTHCHTPSSTHSVNHAHSHSAQSLKPVLAGDPRLISVVAYLSDSEEFEGGQFQMELPAAAGVSTEVRNFTCGAAVAFPSKSLRHVVKPVTAGERRSFLLLVGNSRFGCYTVI